MVQTLWNTVWQFFKMLNTELLYDLKIPLLGMYPRELKTCNHTKTYTWVLIAVSFSQTVEKTQISINWLDKQNVECPYTRILLSHKKEWSAGTAWMNLRNIMQTERSQSQRPHGIWLYLYEISRKGKFTQIESRLLVAMGWREMRENEEWLLLVPGFFSGWYNFNPLNHLRGRYHCYPHFTDEKIEVERDGADI